MNSRSRFTKSSIILGLLFLAMLPFAAGVASARTEVMRWTHAAPENLVRFEALVRTSSQNYGAPTSLGLPQADAQGIYEASIVVADDADVFLVVRAVDNSAQVSPPSNQRFRAAPTSSGGGGTTVEPPIVTEPPIISSLENGTEIPPNPDAIARFDFDSGTATNWLDTGAHSSMVEDDTLFSVVSVGGNSALTTQSGSPNIHSHFVGNPSNLQNLTLTGRMAIETTSGDVGVTAYSQYPTADTYYRLRTNVDTASFELAGHPHSSSSCSGTIDTGVVAKAGVWYQFELVIANAGSANRIAATVWQQGSPRPSSPQVECFDSASNRPLAGTIGVWSAGSSAKYWDDLEIVAVSGPVVTAEPPLPPILISVEPR
jgi:hypothetical protein